MREMQTIVKTSWKVAVALVIACFPVPAQTLDTAILGVVTDPSGAIIPGAAVTITQPATGFSRKVNTNQEGAFEVRYLLPGEYSLEASAAGFTTERRTSVVRPK